MTNIIVAVIVGALAVAFAFLQAQVILFGLATFHIQAGLWGTWMLVVALESIITSGVGSAIRANKNA